MKSRSLFYLSIVGFTLTLIIHILAVAFSYDTATEYSELFMAVLICSFVVFGLPIVVLGLKGGLQSQRGFKIMLFPITFLQIIYKNSPAWLITLNIVCFAYMLLNSTIYPDTFAYSVDVDNNNQYIRHNFYTADGLSNHSTSPVSEKEYLKYRATITGLHTGGTLLFYCIGMAMVYPYDKKQKSKSNTPTV
ncbi:MAG: hypothetical protein M0D57_06280 [Sphingobacteriales bacterium JAD_PAG50586_3]|nr:MAG: hypothetical protein M0D57_06280 [Sphingobacteriales bacterium JAD_PAG50586_3]